ncbi:thiamine phosphate synthase [bacterium]|nr:thiamine phosphate synthase [bacterium]
MALLKDINLYVIIDIPLVERISLDAVDVVRSAFDGGARIFQLRHKGVMEGQLFEEASRISKVAHELGAIFIVNDSLSVALAAGADGVHLGEDDLPVYAARKIVPKNFIIGASVSSVENALKVEREGADYIGYGAIFDTNTKPDAHRGKIEVFKKIQSAVEIPVFAIGGINRKNVLKIVEAGCKQVCMASGIIFEKDIASAVKKIFKILEDSAG